MSILGLTIDFGPFGFMDYFDKGHICNHSDDSGRYCYENQPSVCKWNLLRLAEALKNFIPLKEAQDFLNKEFSVYYFDFYHENMREKVFFNIFFYSFFYYNKVRIIFFWR